MHAGNLEAAVELCLASIKSYPDIKVSLSLASILALQGEYSKAEAVLLNLKKLYPKNVEVCENLALIYLRMGLLELACEQCDIAISLNSRSPIHQLVQARLCLKNNLFTEAGRIHEEIIASGQKTVEARLLAVELHIAQSDYEVALHLAAQLCEEFPSSPSYIRIFRQAFQTFIETEDPARIFDFYEAVSIPSPKVEIIARNSPINRCERQVDIIIPIHNGLSQLKACLKSVLDCMQISIDKIILVDDASDDDTKEFLRGFSSSHNNLRVIHSGCQIGFTQSIMLGLKSSKANYFVALNSDTIVTDGWIEKLLETMHSSPDTAIVGPLSNSAGWQNIGEPLDINGNFHREELPSSEDCQRITASLKNLRTFACPDTPLVHGFCALVCRKTFDQIGGLDVDAFPKGYGEFQDLSIRFWDAGYRAKIADHCFVGHLGSASIDPATRSDLSRSAREQLYAKHSALKYLSFEAASIYHKHLRFVRDRYRVISDTAFPVDVFSAETAVHHVAGNINFDFSGRQVCLFVCYSHDGRILPYTEIYVKSLRAQGLEMVLIINSDVDDDDICFDGLYRLKIRRRNIGFDFGAWHDVLDMAPSLWSADMLVFANCSVLGPFEGFDQLYSSIVESTATVIGLTESNTHRHHFQSYFWALKGEAITASATRAFFQSIHNLETKKSCILMYETFLHHALCKVGGLSYECLFPISALGLDDDHFKTMNPTYYFALQLLEAGFPFLKVDYCRRNYLDGKLHRWIKLVQERGGDRAAAQKHVEMSIMQRNTD